MSNQLIIDLIEVFLKHYPETEFRGAHIVLSDYNLSDSNIYYCLNGLNETDEFKQEKDYELDLLTTQFLLALLQFPEYIRDEE